MGEKTGPTRASFPLRLTFFALKGHPGLQVVHLQLQPFKGAVGVSRLPLVRDQHDDDDQQEESAPAPDADDGGQREQAV